MSPPDMADLPTTPDTALPDGACDCHVHVIGAQGAYPMVPGRHYTPGPASLEALHGHMAALGLQRAVIVQPSVYGTDNRCLLDALDRLEGAGRGVAVLAEDIAPAELRRMHVRGVRGVRINLESTGNEDVTVLEAMLSRWSTRIADLGWHVQLYAASDVVAALTDRLAALPTRVVLDHFALMANASDTDGPETAMEDLLRTGQVLVKLSAPYRLPSPALALVLARAFVKASPTSVLWGSDWPHTARQPEAGRLGISTYRRVTPGELTDALHAWLPSPELKRRVLVANPADLFGF